MVRRKITRSRSKLRPKVARKRLVDDLRKALTRALRDGGLVESLPRLEKSLAKVKVDGLRFDLVHSPGKTTPDSAEASILTGHQREIALLVREGLSNKEIAQVLGVSKHTIANQLKKIYRVLQVNSRTSLALYAERFLS